MKPRMKRHQLRVIRRALRDIRNAASQPALYGRVEFLRGYAAALFDAGQISGAGLSRIEQIMYRANGRCTDKLAAQKSIVESRAMDIERMIDEIRTAPDYCKLQLAASRFDGFLLGLNLPAVQHAKTYHRSLEIAERRRKQLADDFDADRSQRLGEMCA